MGRIKEPKDMGLIETAKKMTLTEWIFTGIIVAAIVVCLGAIIGAW